MLTTLCNVLTMLIITEGFYLQLFGRPQWLTVKSRSHTYVKKVSFCLNTHSNDLTYHKNKTLIIIIFNDSRLEKSWRADLVRYEQDVRCDRFQLLMGVSSSFLQTSK